MDGNNLASAAEPGSERRPYSREWDGESKLVVGIDIGTTSSQISFTFLEPGGEQTVQRVTQWPGQEAQNLQSRIPSLIWYDSNNQPVSFGAEAQAPEAEGRAEDEGWQLVQRFNLHLHPSDLRAKCDQAIEPLPFGVPLLQVYSDFLRYLIHHTQQFFEYRILEGEQIWRRYRQNIVFVIGHPNEYGTREQEFLRSAVIAAGFATTDKAASHIHFVAEAEAFAHFFLYYTCQERLLHVGANVAVCDAGRSTVNTALYNVQDIPPALLLRKVGEPACIPTGGMFVDRLAESYLRQLFENAGLPSDEISEYVARGVASFEGYAKRCFQEPTHDHSIEISGSRLNLPKLGIRRGRLTLKGRTIQLFFDRCVSEIIAGINSQVSSVRVSHILLGGGFGNSSYFCAQLKAWFESMGVQVTRPNESTTKAVADGAILWYCASEVIRPTPRCAFGTGIDVPFDRDNTEHRGRQTCKLLSGTCVAGKWFQIVSKGEPIHHGAIRRQNHSRGYWGPDVDLGVLEEVFYKHSHDDSPGWLTSKSGEILDGFQKHATITADLSAMQGALQPRINIFGARYWSLTFNLCFRFSHTGLEVFLEWATEDTIKTMPVDFVMEPEV